MSHENAEDLEFAERARQALDASVDDLDELTIARLNAARARAVDAAGRSRWFGVVDGARRWAGLGAVACTVLVASVVVLLPEHSGTAPDAAYTSTAQGSATAAPLDTEELEMVSELDFLLWLDESDAAL